jgi:hypothetical protein
MQKVAPTTTSEDAKELVKLCRTGRLYDVQKWIAEGKPLEVSAPRKKTLLEIAVETEFDSLVELIGKHERDQVSKNAALGDAVALRRLDLVELLLEDGAEITSVPFADVLLTWDPKLMRFFFDHSADPIKGSPFVVAFGAKVRTALRAFLECKRMHPETCTCALRCQKEERIRRESEEQRRAQEMVQLRKEIEEEEKNLEQFNRWLESWGS